ncbi:MAG: DUF4199 domain-containing protein [Bacteroidales bacterium]|nr:DUF4199 domain-containing protein [Bacteroidales bacterium]
MNRKLWGICLKWGLVLGGMLAVLEVVKMVARQVEYGSAQLFDLAMIIGYILILYAGIKEFKASYPNRLSFPKAYLCGLILSIIGSVIFFGYNLIHYQVIEKDGLSKKYNTALENFRKVIDKDTIRADELTWYVDTVRVLVEAAEKDYLLQNPRPDSVEMDVHKGVSLINSYFADKVATRRSSDTTNHYRMSNFAPYAKGVMVETLQLYIAQNEQHASTSDVKEIVQRALVTIGPINPAQRRFELNKSHVPHYDQAVTYASVSALMDLLYGMFFSIFVAMYHYRSKEPAPEEEETEPTEPEEPEETPES